MVVQKQINSMENENKILNKEIHSEDFLYLINKSVRKLETQTIYSNGASKKELQQDLFNNIMHYFGCTYKTLNTYLSMFSLSEVVELMKAMSSDKSPLIMCNFLRSKPDKLMNALSSKGLIVEPTGKWNIAGLYIRYTNFTGFNLEFMSGNYYNLKQVFAFPV